MLYPELYKDLTKVRLPRSRGGSCSAPPKTVLVRRAHPLSVGALAPGRVFLRWGRPLPSGAAVCTWVGRGPGVFTGYPLVATGRRACCSIDRAAPPVSQGRSLSFKTFLIWVLISIYQGKTDPLLLG